jgi:hypothetical protein
MPGLEPADLSFPEPKWNSNDIELISDRDYILIVIQQGPPSLGSQATPGT